MRTTPSRFTPFALALALAVPSLAAAQPDAGRRGGATAEERAERIEARMAERVEKLREELSLSDAQAARIARIFEESRAEMARLREAGRSPETRQAFRQLRWTTDDRIHEVLSAEQAEQLRQLRRDERLEHREARRGRRGMRGHHGHRGMRGERGPRGPRGERPELTPEQRQERRHLLHHPHAAISCAERMLNRPVGGGAELAKHEEHNDQEHGHRLRLSGRSRMAARAWSELAGVQVWRS